MARMMIQNTFAPRLGGTRISLFRRSDSTRSCNVEGGDPAAVDNSDMYTLPARETGTRVYSMPNGLASASAKAAHEVSGIMPRFRSFPTYLVRGSFDVILLPRRSLSVTTVQ